MSRNILITGAAGYIGGSLVADFLSRGLFEKENVTAAVRSDEQAKALSSLGINVIQLDLNNEDVVIENILKHKISIIVHTASSINSTLALNLITALGKQTEVAGEQTYFIHTSGLSAFFERTGWPRGHWKDNDPIFDTEKKLRDSFPLRETDVAVVEHAKTIGVTSFIVVPSIVYGKGTGAWNQLSVVNPIFIKACIEQKTVYRFAENTKASGVHISDLTDLYGQIIKKILQNEPIQSDEKGHYFALAHDIISWEYLDKLAAALKARDLVADSETPTWPSDEAAAAALGVPVDFVQPLWNSGEDMVAEKNHRIGWQPSWNKERFLQSLDDEIDAVVKLGKAKSSLVDSLFAAAGKQ